MILRLSGADFSANNIGKIDIVREVTYETKELLANFSKSFTHEQALAVQDFIGGLKSSGVWAAIGNLYIPIMAGSLSECGFNVKTGENDVTFGEADYVLSDKGIKLVPTTTNYWDTASKIKVNASQQNLHYGAYNTDSYTGMTQTDAIFGYSDNVSVLQFGITAEGKISTKTDNNSSIVTGSANNEGWENPSLKMLVQTTLGNFINMNGKAGEYGTPIATDNTYTDIPLKLFNVANVWRETYSQYGLLTVGTAMTREQSEKYAELCGNLMGKLVN